MRGGSDTLGPVRHGRERAGSPRRLARSRLPVLLCAAVAIGTGGLDPGDVHAADPAATRAAAVQRLHWAGLYLPDVEIDVDGTGIATVTGSVASDIVRDEVVETVEMTSGIRGVVDRLAVRR